MGEGVLSKRTPHPASPALRKFPEGAEIWGVSGESQIERRPMAAKRTETTTKRRRPPAKTAAGRANQLKAMAYDLAAAKLEDGTASNQLIIQFLKVDPVREELERERLENENTLLKARVSALESGQRLEELYAEALDAMKGYRGEVEDD